MLRQCLSFSSLAAVVNLEMSWCGARGESLRRSLGFKNDRRLNDRRIQGYKCSLSVCSPLSKKAVIVMMCDFNFRWKNWKCVDFPKSVNYFSKNKEPYNILEKKSVPHKKKWYWYIIVRNCYFSFQTLQNTKGMKYFKYL